jgi:hypothetical protein
MRIAAVLRLFASEIKNGLRKINALVGINRCLTVQQTVMQNPTGENARINFPESTFLLPVCSSQSQG